MPLKIAHLTSVHGRYDVRIYLKMCRSLARHGHSVWLVVADGKGDEVRDDVSLTDVGAPKGRADRMLHAPSRILDRAIALDADIYHLHDPELLPVGLKLKRLGKRVIFDSHEDYPASIMTKSYIPAPLRRAVATLAKWYERRAVRKLDFVVAATPAIRDKFASLGCETTDINNYPLLDELSSADAWEGRNREVCYVGGIAERRGILQVVDAMAHTQSGVSLNLVGEFSDQATQDRAAASPGWSKVNALGHLSRADVRDVLRRSVAGVVTFLPAPNHLDAQPNKMFEYMSSGIPVISSDFPLWREIIAGNDCGVCVDPLAPRSIAAAIDQLVNDHDTAERMGRNGRSAVVAKFNWEAEEKKLSAVYEKLLGSKIASRA